MTSLFEASLLLKTYLFNWIVTNMYGQEVVCFKVDSCVVLLDILASLSISYELGDFAPVSKAVPLLKINVLLEPFK